MSNDNGNANTHTHTYSTRNEFEIRSTIHITAKPAKDHGLSAEKKSEREKKRRKPHITLHTHHVYETTIILLHCVWIMSDYFNIELNYNKTNAKDQRKSNEGERMVERKGREHVE